MVRVKTVLVGIAFLGQANAVCHSEAPTGESAHWNCTEVVAGKKPCCTSTKPGVGQTKAGPTMSITSVSTTAVDKATDKTSVDSATDKPTVDPEVIMDGSAPPVVPEVIMGGSYCTWEPELHCYPGKLNGHPSCCADAKTCPADREKCAPTAKTDDKTTVSTTDKTTTTPISYIPISYIPDDKTETTPISYISEVFCAGFNVKIPPSEKCPTDCMYCPEKLFERRLLFATTPTKPAPKPAKKCCPIHDNLFMG